MQEKGEQHRRQHQQQQSLTSPLAPPCREDRLQCWNVRDELFKCLENIDLKEESSKESCKALKELLYQSCPNSWVCYHFFSKLIIRHNILLINI